METLAFDDSTVAFLEHGVVKPVFNCFLVECDRFNKSFASSSSTSEMHHDTSVQGPLALHGTSTENDSNLQLARPLNIPHWMSSKQVQRKDTSPQSGFTEKLFLSNVQTKSGTAGAFPSKLRYGSDGQSYSYFASESWAHEARSRQNVQQQLTAGPPPFNRDVLKEENKVSMEDASSSFLHAPEKHSAKGCFTDPPTLSLGLSSGNQGHQRVAESSWVSKFPFQIAMNSESPEFGQLTYCRDQIGHNVLTKPNNKSCNQGSCKGVANIPSQLIPSKGGIGHHKSSWEDSLCSAPSANDVLAKRASLGGLNLNSPWPLPQTAPVSNVSSPKRDRNATLVEGAKHAQLLPDLFSQMTGVGNARQSHVLSKDTNITIFDSLGSRPSEIKNGFSFPSIPSAFHTSSIDATMRKEWNVNNGEEALKARSSLSEQDMLKSSRQVALIGVKHEILPDDSETRQSTVEYGKIASSQGRVLTEALSFSTGPAVNQAIKQPATITCVRAGMVSNSQAAELVLFRDVASTEQSTIDSKGVSSLPLPKGSPNFLSLEGGKACANENAPLHKDWGAFLAAPRSIGHASEMEGKLILPFQQRFEQLQKFLKQCDGSERDYTMQALWALSGSKRSKYSEKLQSRAARLALEEGDGQHLRNTQLRESVWWVGFWVVDLYMYFAGKEMKRAKLLNILDDFPDGPLVNVQARSMAPLLSASIKTAVVKEG